MPRLLQINVTANSGSTGRIAEGIGRLAMADGFESTIAYGRGDGGGSASQLLRIGSTADVIAHGLLTRLTDRHGLGSAAATRRLVAEMERMQPDIIHLHNIHGYYLNYRLLFDFLAGSGIPVVWTLHDCWPMTGHCAYFSRKGCGLWREGCHDCPLHRSYPGSLLADRSRRNFADKKAAFGAVENMTIVGVSDWLHSIAAESFLGHYPALTIRNGIDLGAFSPGTAEDNAATRAALGIGCREKMLLGAANVWTANKGLDDFIRLSRRLPDGVRTVLVGLTRRQLRSLPRNIIGLEHTADCTRLAALYSAADVFVNPSWEDSLSMTNIEAAACGTPVASYDSCGMPETLSEATGIAVARGDVGALAAAAIELCGRDRRQTAEACRSHAAAHFDAGRCFAAYIELYRRLLRTGNR